jgi:cbb3-type cytochrome c oxidase subunit III
MKRYARFFVLVALAFIYLAIRFHGTSMAQPAPSGAAIDGKAIFATRCAACHQANGLGAGPFPPLAGNAAVTTADTASLIAIVLNGKTGPITVNGKQYAGAMPAWKDKLTHGEIAAVLTYVRSAWGNSAPAISEDQVALAANPMMLSGEEVFAAKCATCHQAGGGGTSAFPALAGNAAVVAADPSTIVGIIVNGKTGPLEANGKTYDGTMPAWKGELSNSAIAAVATYIRGAWGNTASGVTEDQVAAAGASVSTAVGKSIYENRCISCHGPAGAGSGPFPALAGNATVTATDPSAMLSTIKNGRDVMPSWKGQLSDADIAAVATYVRNAWGNHAPAVTTQDVGAAK